MDGWGERQESDTHTDAKPFSYHKACLTPYLLCTVVSRWPPWESGSELGLLAGGKGIFGDSEKKGESAYSVLGQILLLRLFIKLFVNVTLKFRLRSSPCSAEFCKEKDLPLFYYVPYCSPLRQLQTSYLSGKLVESIDVRGIKAGQTKKSAWPIALSLSSPVAECNEYYDPDRIPTK